MKKEGSVYDYFENILWIILIVILLLAIGYYINYIMSTVGNTIRPSHTQYIAPNGKTAHHNIVHDIDKHNSRALSTAPPKLVNLYEEDYKVVRNKNDIECVNRDSILLYDNTYNADNDNFDVELMRPYHKNNKFLEELENVYNTRISSREAGDIEFDEIYDHSLREQKTDLPLANIPVYALLDNKPLKLSDRRISDI
jgi:hypothetical protein